MRELTLLLYFRESMTVLPFSIKIIKIISKEKMAIFIAIGMILLAGLFCFFIVFCIAKKFQRSRLRQRTLMRMILARQRSENNSEEQPASSEGSEINEEEENKKKIYILLKTELSQKIFIKEYGLKDGNICTICIENFKENKSKVSVTPCQHVFHFKCLSNWLFKNVMNPKCPNCNYNFFEEFNKEKLETIDIYIKKNENQDNKIQNTDEQNINTIENALILRNTNSRNRNRIITISAQSTDENMLGNNGNDNGSSGDDGDLF
jgi:hypothetical protein